MCIKQSMLWAVTLLIGLNTSVQANQSQTPPLRQTFQGLASGFVPPEEGAPKKTTTAGSRESAQCPGDGAPIRAFLPPGGNYGLTVAERPILFLEMPNTQAQDVLLVFQTETGEDYAEAVLPIPTANEQGIVQFQAPEEMGDLAIGKTYNWTISILCNGRLDPSNPFFSGWVQRTAPSQEISQTLESQSLTARLNQLQALGYWYDMLPLILNDQAQLDRIRDY